MDKKAKVLIADGNSVIRSRIADFLSTKEEISLCDTVGNGSQALAIASEKRYDIVLMDVILQQVDGFGVLDELNKMDHVPKVIIISALSQDDIIRRVCEMGAYYYVIKPFNMDALFKRILDALSVPAGGEREILKPSASRQTAPVKSLDERIANIFLAVGIPAHIKGYHFLREAVKLVYKDRAIINSITKQLYPSVAELFETSPSKVERAIRHAIEVSWSRGKIENINGIFGYTIYNSHEKPTNGEFIALVGDKLLMDDLTRNEQSAMAV